jgi:hypothetical protein
MAAILYLDVDDEITSAAARIRAVTETKVALVLPPGSRLATSRINFRLLAREALERNRVLSIVAADPAARSIAASAGLPVHATVAEYEAEVGSPTTPGPPPVSGTPVEPSTSKPGRRRAAGAAAAGAAGAAGAAAAGSAGTPGSPGPGVGPDGSSRPEQLSAELVAPVVAATATARTTPPAKPTTEAVPSPIVPGPSETRARSGAATIPIVPGATSGRGVPGGLAATGAVIVVVLLIVALLGYVVLPAASVVVTPVPVPVGPVEFVVRADPDATSVDPAGGVVPATRLSQDFTASGEFEATGERVVQTKATGTLRWKNCDPTASYTIPTATVAQTGSGVGFETLSAVFLPVAEASPDGTRITCKSRDVRSRAARAGPGGNVGAGTVSVVPPSLNSVVIKVSNPAAMTGGRRDVFPKVQQKDIDAAMASLTKDLQAQFDAWVAAPDGVPPGSTVFPATGKLGTPVPSVDPGTIVDVEEKTFQLGATATGTVVAVDPKLIDQVAAERIAASVPAEHTLQSGSVKSSHDGGQADGDLVDFRVTANAAAIPNLDPAALRDEIKGRSVDEAKQILGRYGTVAIDTWPGFVSSIPTLDFRLDLKVAGASPGTSPSPGPSGSAP